MADQRDLPGWPRKQLVKRVRSHLWQYGIRPQQELWRAAWTWASAVARSYFHTTWPSPHEIATQYVILLLAKMHQRRMLRLPHRAQQAMPPEIRQRLPAGPIPLLGDSGGDSRSKSTSATSP